VSSNQVSGKAEDTVVKFCTQVGYVNSQHMDDKSLLIAAWSGSHWRICNVNSRNGWILCILCRIYQVFVLGWHTTP